MLLWGWFYEHYFRVETEGWHHIPNQEQVLLVGSHNGGMATPDMIMSMYDWFRNFGTQRPIYGLMHKRVWNLSLDLARLAEKVGAIEAHPKMAIAALQTKASVLVYPGGSKDVFRLHKQRHQIELAGNQAFIKLALKYHVPIIPIISTGAHDTLFVLADFYEQAKQLHQLGMPWFLGIDPEVFPLYLGLPWGLSIGPLPNIPLPVKIKTRVCPPIMFTKYGKQAAQDRQYVNDCYELVVKQMQLELDDLAAVKVS